MKILKYIGSRLKDPKDFPAEARRAAGFELDAIQRGLIPSDWKPMNNVGAGAYEIRVNAIKLMVTACFVGSNLFEQ